MFKHSLSMRQIYVTTWGLMCYLGMVSIALAFIVQRINDEVKIASPFGDKPVILDGMYLSSSGKVTVGASGGAESPTGMTKGTAMLLCFSYAAIAWMMSNGIVANPRMAAFKT